MTIIWRIFLLTILHAGVLILFPNYPPSAPVTVLVLFGAFVLVTLLLSAIFSILWLSRSIAFTALFDFLLVVSVSVVLLLLTPQSNQESPADKLMRGKYPTVADAQMGWSSFKLLFSKDSLQRDIAPVMTEFNRGAKVIKEAVEKDKISKRQAPADTGNEHKEKSRFKFFENTEKGQK